MKLSTKRSISPHKALFLLPILLLFFVTDSYAVKILKGRALYRYSNRNAVHGGILRTIYGTPPRSLDTHQETAAGCCYITNLTNSTLIRISQDFMGVEPDLAKSWKVIGDRTYVFKLHKGVRFHDVPPVNGRELTSADVKYSFERIMGMHGNKADFKHRYYFEDKLESIETPDKYTIIFKAKKPYAALLRYFASAWCTIVAKEVVDKYGDLKMQAIGTGPFILKEYVKGSHFEFVKHPHYFKKGLPYLDGINAKLITDPNAALSAYLAGKLDVGGLYFFQVKVFKEKAPKDTLFMAPGTYMWTFRMPPEIKDKLPLKAPYNNKKVRQAVAMAIDKKELLKLAWGGAGDTCVGPIPVKQWMLSSRYQVKYNPEKAKKILAEAGYPNGFKAEMITWNSLYMTKPAQVIQQMLKKVGVDMTIKALEFAQYFNLAYRFQYEMALHIMTAGVDPEEWLVPYYGYPDKSTYYKWTNRKLWDMIAKQAHIMNHRKRMALIHRIQQQVIDDSPNVFLYTQTRYAIQKPYVHRKFYFGDIQYFSHAEYTWMEKH
jgi:peptide/nickel transport system substrate-binding protein